MKKLASLLTINGLAPTYAINHVIAGPDLHRPEPLALWGFLQDLSDKYMEDQSKVLRV